MEIGERADIEMKLSEKAMDHLTDSFKETAKYSSGKGEKGHVVGYYTWSGTVKFL
jgi:hypothetical protein